MSKFQCATFLCFLMLSSSLAGCVTEDGNVAPTEPEDFGIDSLPKSAIGINMPVIDGQIDRQHFIFVSQW